MHPFEVTVKDNGKIGLSPDQELTYAETEEFDLRHTMLNKAMEKLNEREKHIILKRRLEESPLTLEELSKIYGISRERVRQIEVRAFEKLQNAMISESSSHQ